MLNSSRPRLPKAILDGELATVTAWGPGRVPLPAVAIGSCGLVSAGIRAPPR